jgi:hypothetical protein
MSSLADETPKVAAKADDDDDNLVDDTFTAERPGSLEALQSEELGESDKEYQQDTYGSE